MLNTLKTTWGWIVGLVDRVIPVRSKSQSVENIYNYLQISEELCTSGQPREEEFELIRAAGYKTIINLAPTHVIENSLRDEAQIVSSLGLDYVHIPVDFKNPTEKKFEQFSASYQAVAAGKTWVHCAANMRVSAFIYRYRCAILEEDELQARRDLVKIWEPFGVWKKFVSRQSPS